MTYATRRIELDGIRRQRAWPTKRARDEYVRDLEDKRARLSAGMPTPLGAISYAELVELFFSNRRAFKQGEPDYGRLLSAIVLT